MANPFLAQAALRYATTKNNQAKEALAKQHLQEADDRKRKLDNKYQLEYQRDLNDLAYEHTLKVQDQRNALLTQQNLQRAETFKALEEKETDPQLRKQYRKMSTVFSVAREMEPKAIMETMDAFTPPAPSVTELTADRKRAEGALFDAAMSKLSEVDVGELENNPNYRAAIQASLTKNLSKERADMILESLEDMVQYGNIDKDENIPDPVKQAVTTYHKLELERIKMVGREELDEQKISGIFDAKLNSLADQVNAWADTVEGGENYKLDRFEAVDVTTPPNALMKFFNMPRTPEFEYGVRIPPGVSAPPLDSGKQLNLSDFIVQTYADHPEITDEELTELLKDKGYVE